MTETELRKIAEWAGDVERWKRPRIVAQVWGCGDECSCYQPEIVRVEPNFEAGFPWIKRTELWKGLFLSEPWDTPREWAKQAREFKAAAKRYGIRLHRNYRGDWSGERDA